jgi:hypothetical protein
MTKRGDIGTCVVIQINRISNFGTSQIREYAFVDMGRGRDFEKSKILF